MTTDNETVADVVLEMRERAYKGHHLISSALEMIADRIQAAHAREVEALTKGLRVAAIALAHASETDATNRPAYQHVSDLLAGTHIADAGNMVEALRLRAEAAEADARRWRHVRDEMTHHYGDGQTEPRECVIHLEWFQGPWVRDGSNRGLGRPDSFPGWDTIVDEAITKLADELQELDDDAAIASASGGEG